MESFAQRMFTNFDVANFYANIDPLFGDENDHRKVVDIIRSYFPAALIHEPETANFCAAVRRNWSSTTGKFVLHMEDDWRLNSVIDSTILEEFFDKRVMQVAFQSAEKKWDVGRRGKIHYHRKPLKLFGCNLPIKIKAPVFTTSPSILNGMFARNAASLYDVRFDPEKQFYKGLNPELENYVAPFKAIIYSVTSGFVITDLGREWREKRGVRKTIQGGVSKWNA